MMSPRTYKLFDSISRELDALQDGTVGARLKEYIRENNHEGWDGCTSADLTGVRRFLEDFILYTTYFVCPPGKDET